MPVGGNDCLLLVLIDFEKMPSIFGNKNHYTPDFSFPNAVQSYGTVLLMSKRN